MTVKCPKCKTENTSDSEFCKKCATPLPGQKVKDLSFTRTLETPSEQLRRGTTFAGRYEVIEELGKGGMGEVYRVEDTKVSEEIALKLIKPEIAADKKTIIRFQNELKTTRKLRHKNICGMYDLGEDKGINFITMEYIPGEDLRSFIMRSKQLSIPTAISVAKQVCAGLAEAHRLGVVHRDLKPSNIMIDKEGNARIMDFGIARSLKTEGVTGEGMMIGTPDYMSPEQAEAKEIDQRSDLYSLGVVLYEMVTGELPFQGDTPLSVAMKHKSEQPKEPMVVNAHVSADLNQVILRCLEKDKELRYQTAEELFEALDKIEKGIPTDERISPKKRTKTEISKMKLRPFLVPGIILAVVVIAVLSLLLTTNFLKTKAPETMASAESGWVNSIAVLPFRDFSQNKDQEYFCDGMTDAIINRLHNIGELKVISLTSVMNYKDPDRNIKKIGQELDVDTILEGSIQREDHRIRLSAQLINVSDDSHLWADSFDREVESLFDVQDDISKAIAEALKVTLTPDTLESVKSDHPENLEAYEYYLKGMHFIKSKFVITFQEEDFQQGKEMFEKAIAIDPNYALAYYGLSFAYEHSYQLTGNKEARELMQANCDKAWELDPDLSQINALRGYYFYEYIDDYDGAFQHGKKAVQMNPNASFPNISLGMSYLYHGLYHQGIQYLKKGVELDPYYLWGPYKLAQCYMNTGDFENAAYYFEKYFELAPFVMIYPGRPISLYLMKKDYDRVEELIAETEKIRPNYYGIPYGRAILHATKGEKEKALSLYQNSEIYALLGMNDEAIEHLEQEIANRKEHPYCYYHLLLNNSFYDNIRNDSRFETIVKKEKKIYERELKKYADF